MSKLPPPYRSSNAMVRALLGDFAAAPRNAMREYREGPADASPGPTNFLAAFRMPVPESSLGLLGAFVRSPYPPQTPFDCRLREAAWIKTAGHVDAPDCYDEENEWLDRNAKTGEPGAWEAAHYVDGALGGPDTAGNVRALNTFRNRSDGGILGNWMKRYRDGK